MESELELATSCRGLVVIKLGTIPKMHYNKTGMTPCPRKVAIPSLSLPANYLGGIETQLSEIELTRHQISD